MKNVRHVIVICSKNYLEKIIYHYLEKVVKYSHMEITTDNEQFNNLK